MRDERAANDRAERPAQRPAIDSAPTMERLPEHPCERCGTDRWYRSRGMYYRKCADCNPYYAPGGEGEEQLVAGRDEPAPAPAQALPLFAADEVSS